MTRRGLLGLLATGVGVVTLGGLPAVLPPRFTIATLRFGGGGYVIHEFWATDRETPLVKIFAHRRLTLLLGPGQRMPEKYEPWTRIGAAGHSIQDSAGCPFSCPRALDRRLPHPVRPQYDHRRYS
jgi:hypothetical protein